MVDALDDLIANVSIGGKIDFRLTKAQLGE